MSDTQIKAHRHLHIAYNKVSEIGKFPIAKNEMHEQLVFDI